MNYWKLQIRNGETGENFVDEVLDDKRITTHEDYAQGFLAQAKMGDIVLVHKGAHPQCLVKIKYKIIDPSEIIGTSFGHDYKVEIISWYKDVYNNKNIFDIPFIVGHNGTFTLLYNQSNTLMQVKKWHHYFLKLGEMEKNINLLRYKKQIILQGPPGTGKTRKAKKIADEILNVNPQNFTPLQLIENFFKEGKSNSEYNLAFKKRLEEFYQLFPKNEFAKMNLDDYCIGKGGQSNFCWWIEVGLSKYGKFSPGNSRNYVIYFSKSDDDYVLCKVDDESISEAFPKITQALQKLALDENKLDAEKIFGDSFIIKILNSYYPEKYFPINGRTALVNLMKLFGKDSKNIKTIDLNLGVQNVFREYKNKYPSEITNLDFMKFLYSKFNLNNDGNLLDSSVEDIIKRKPTIIQFHPSYTYEDFVRGIVAKSTDKGIVYIVENKILAELAKEAYENQYSDYVLIIDEINRANLSSVLGELIYALEYRYYFEDSEEKQNESKVESPYSLIDENIDKTSREIFLPENLYIIGTMNTADRSVGHIDYAIKRRFAFVDVLPEIEPVHPLIKEVFIKISNLFIKNFDGTSIPQVIEKSDSLASDFRPEDIWIGHSYFICKKQGSNEDEDDAIAKPILNMKLKYEIIPLLKEYIKDGILNETEQVKTVMNELISKDFSE